MPGIEVVNSIFSATFCLFYLFYVPWSYESDRSWGPVLCVVSSEVLTSLPFLSHIDLCVVKRKRGRPKGSTKKSVTEEEPAENNGSFAQDGQPENEDVWLSSEPVPENLECRKCSRTFSNVRQLKKHICIIVFNDDEDVTQGETKWMQDRVNKSVRFSFHHRTFFLLFAIC